jgi:hypothetical protein
VRIVEALKERLVLFSLGKSKLQNSAEVKWIIAGGNYVPEAQLIGLKFFVAKQLEEKKRTEITTKTIP